MLSTRCTGSSSAARCFVQLSQRYWSRRRVLPALDFLLPPQQPAGCATSTGGQRRPSSTKHSRYRDGKLRLCLGGASPGGTNPSVDRALSAAQHLRRPFSSTLARRGTRAIFNPQTDDDGNEMKLEITDRAAERLSQVMTKDSNPYLALRIQVESGGCHGFQYLMSLVTLPDTLPSPGSPAATGDSGTLRDDDTIFAHQAGSSTGPDLELPKIVLDTPSLDLLKGSKVDFTMELIGSQFKIVDNPLATSSCGCGTSFDIKI